jgi:dTDP-glucose 4,6-dehydratase
VLQEGEIGKAYHISSPEEFSVVDVVRKVLSQFGLPYDDTTIDTSSDRSGADLRYALDCSRIRALGWSAKRRFDDELPKIVEETRQVLVASGETTLRPVASGRKPRPRRTGGRRRGRRKGG